MSVPITLLSLLALGLFAAMIYFLEQSRRQRIEKEKEDAEKLQAALDQQRVEIDRSAHPVSFMRQWTKK